MDISVILPTSRTGGLDNLTFPGLIKQDFDGDFELILIDGNPDRMWLSPPRYNYPIRILPDKKPYFKTNRGIANARNTGLTYAKGELIVFIDDYTWIPPDFLQNHWDTYDMLGYCTIGSVVSIHYHEKQITSEKDFKIRHIDGRNIDHTWTKDHGAIDTRTSVLKAENVKDCIAGWFYCSNASAPLDKIIQINGFDEEMDATCEEDIDLGLRLERVGCKFWFKGNIIAYHMNHGTPEINPPLKFPDEDCHKVTMGMYHPDKEGSWAVILRNQNKLPQADSNPNFNLKDEREKIEL